MYEEKRELVPLGLPDELRAQFDNDTNVICDSTERLLKEIFPYYLADNTFDDDKIEIDSNDIVKAMNFFKIADCTIEDVDDVFLYLNEKIQKFLSAAYSVGTIVCYGIVGQNGNTSIVLGVDPVSADNKNAETIKSVTQGLLPGITLKDFKCDSKVSDNMQYGLIGGVPTVKIKDDVQRFDFAPIVRSLNGQNFTLLVMARPLSAANVQDKIGQLLHIKDQCAAISKRNVSMQRSTSQNTQESWANTDGSSEGSSWGGSVNAAPIGMGIGAIIGSIVAPGIGTAAGAAIGGAIGGGFSVNNGKNSSINHSESYTKSISEAITQGGTMSLDIQNGFAMELIKYAENAIERLKIGQNTGMWQAAISYSADSEVAINLLQGCLYSEVARPNPELLPPRAFKAAAKALPFSKSEKNNQLLIIPKNFFTKNACDSSVCSVINTQELSLLCSLPDKNVPGFEIKTGKFYPMTQGTSYSPDQPEGSVDLGHVCDCERELENVEFKLTDSDLNKHVFVCGITGSGKTNTVKHILSKVDKPFLVIECAKKEYRNMVYGKNEGDEKVTVYTLGRPEINCISINPFYILPGTSPQTHIDYLKDLFNASFSMYGPMPYIIEKCLHNIYLKRGWDLTLGYHPYLVNTKNSMDFFDEIYIRQQYNKPEHKFIFPTMTDLKNEIESYIKKHMDYKGEVSDNIRTAIITRLESLCVGAKGYMFDTYEMADFDALLSRNCVFELEGLADDSDKAFTVGLLVIYINEYRQLYKETQIENTNKLQHLLVIEEAHRLLKNVATERTSENMGNPKGKAVEHFTNMIAEMRSYGQGVIIAEQIPSKITPDVIKNTSNKIIHRIVSSDDQEFIANMIGVDKKDSIFLGNQKTGYALCHKEGMRLPVSVKIPQQKNSIVKDDDLRQKNLKNQSFLITKSIIRTHLVDSIDQYVVRLLNTMLTYDVEQTMQGIKITFETAVKIMRRHASPIPWRDELNNGIAELLSENIVKLMLIGVYSSGVSLPDVLGNEITEALKNPYKEPIRKLIGTLRTIYQDVDMSKNAVTELAANYILENPNLEVNYPQLVKSYFAAVNPSVINDIVSILRKRNDRDD
jgi:hypothetical protein